MKELLADGVKYDHDLSEVATKDSYHSLAFLSLAISPTIDVNHLVVNHVLCRYDALNENLINLFSELIDKLLVLLLLTHLLSLQLGLHLVFLSLDLGLLDSLKLLNAFVHLLHMDLARYINVAGDHRVGVSLKVFELIDEAFCL